MHVTKLLGIAAIGLLTLSLIEVILVASAFSPSPLPFPEHSEGWFVVYQANPIGKPILGDYWVLTDPDAAILEAIAESFLPEISDEQGVWEHWTWARANETTFIYQVYEHGQVWNIEYAGHYYCVDCLYHIDDHPEPHIYITVETYVLHRARHKRNLTAAGAFLSVAWIGLGVVWIKKKPQQP